MMGWLIPLGYLTGFAVCTVLFALASVREFDENDMPGYIQAVVLGATAALVWPLALAVWWIAKKLRDINERQPHE